MNRRNFLKLVIGTALIPVLPKIIAGDNKNVLMAKKEVDFDNLPSQWYMRPLPMPLSATVTMPPNNFICVDDIITLGNDGEQYTVTKVENKLNNSENIIEFIPIMNKRF